MNGDPSQDTPSVLVLLSGGIDSTACVAFYVRQGVRPRALFVDYGQPAALAERASASAVCAHYGLVLDSIVVAGLSRTGPGYVPARNALLVSVGLACLPFDSGLVALGIHAGTGYQDCSGAFVRACQAVADIYSAGAVRIDAPFLDWTKNEIVRFCRDEGVPLHRTHSCEAAGPTPCGECATCKDLAAIREAGR